MKAMCPPGCKNLRLTSSVQYRPNDSVSNRLLLLVLFEKWGYRCYFCKTTVQRNSLEVDHIIPQSKFVSRATAHSLNFSVHDLQNLAPICGPCNKTKSSKTYDDSIGTLAIADALREALKLAASVEKTFKEYHALEGVERAVLAIVLTPASTTYSGEFDSLSRLLVQHLNDRGFNPEHRYLDFVRCESDDGSTVVTIGLDSSGRFAKRVTEDLFGQDFGALLVASVDETKRELRRKAVSESQMENVSFESAPDWLIPSVAKVAWGEEVEPSLVISGFIDDFDLGTATVDLDGGEELLDIQLMATYKGEFSVIVWLDDGPAEVQADVDDVLVVVESDN